MSLQGKDTAFISLGIACQTSHQLTVNREMLSSLVGEPLHYRSSFFNWVMVSATDIGRTLERLVAGPITARSLRIPAARGRCLTLAGHKAWLWHEEPSDAVTAAKADAMAGKYDHLRRNFLDLCRRPTRYFILCNAQNNCARLEPHLEEGMHLGIDDDVVRDVERTLDRLFPRGRNHLVTIARRDRRASRMREPVSVIDGDDTEWKGSAEAWRQVLLDWFARREQRKTIASFRVFIG